MSQHLLPLTWPDLNKGLAEAQGAVVGIEFTAELSGAHFLPQLPPGAKCAQVHGHNWKITFQVDVKTVAADGMVIDFHDLTAIVNAYDHRMLNDLPPFQDDTRISTFAPTAENLARVFGVQVLAIARSRSLFILGIGIEVAESEKGSAFWRWTP